MLWECWSRCMMGLKPSPYFCIKGLLLALEMVKGDRWDERNPFQWGGVVLNLPGSAQYEPSQPKIYRVKLHSTEIAAVLLSYVDDMRAADGGEEECWRVMHHVATQLNYLGIQIASRKTRPPARNPGPWAGSVVMTDDNGIGVRATQEKWDKVKGLVHHLWRQLACGDDLNMKELESIRGVLVYLQRTYPSITPYLKGLHLTIDSWRPNRDADGWKDAKISKEECVAAQLTPPCTVQAVPRLRDDVQSLLCLFSSETPPIRYVRSQKLGVAIYGFGDASGAGFGRTFSKANDTYFCHGVYAKDELSNSSNYRELSNLVTALEDGVKEGYLANAEIWIFTDNSTAESVFCKGHSSSPKLNHLALRLRQLEMNDSINVQMIHVPGTRMIQQGTDGLSRGVLTEGVMAGKQMLSFVPLHQGALERQPALLGWIQCWLPRNSLIVLSCEDWFDKGHGISSGSINQEGRWMPHDLKQGWLLWAPPPAIADVAVEELEISRHKRKHLNHIFISPRLMTFAWRKKLRKICDVLFEIPAGARCFWPQQEHEPLLVGLTLCFSPSSPWQFKRTGRVLELDGLLREVWKNKDSDERVILQQLCGHPWWLGPMS
jgi:hypothetical protein